MTFFLKGSISVAVVLFNSFLGWQIVLGEQILIYTQQINNEKWDFNVDLLAS